MLSRVYSLSPHARLEASPERLLVCDAPLQSARLGEAEWAVLEALRPGVPIQRYMTGLTQAWCDFLDGLVARGFLNASFQAGPPRVWPEAEVIVPVFGNAQGLARCLEALSGQTYPSERLRVTVVDDASPTPLAEALAGRDFGGLPLRWLRSEVNRGPASARNLGAAESPAQMLAFVDSDCVPAPDWLAELAAVLESPGFDTAGIDTAGIATQGFDTQGNDNPAMEPPTIDAVGGGVVPLDTSRLLGRYEGACSSLVLGHRPGAAGGIGHRFSYLPSCNLAVGRAAFEKVGGFQEGWRTGEDVDFSWRLAGQGFRLFYWPHARVAHDFRVRWGAFLQRRRVYARSEARLRRLHPARFRLPLRWSGWAMLRGVCGALLTGSALWSALWLPVALAGWLAPALRPMLPVRMRGKAGGKKGGGGKTGGGKTAAGKKSGNYPAPWTLKARLAASGRAAAGVLIHHGRNTARQSMAAWAGLLALWPELWPAALAVFSLGAAGDWNARRNGAGHQLSAPTGSGQNSSGQVGLEMPRLSPPEFLAGFVGEILAYSLGRMEGAVGDWGRRFRPGTRGHGGVEKTG